MIVHNHNSEAFLSAFEALEKRGAAEACLMIVDGEPGLGKSAFAQWWAVGTQSLYMRARKEWSPAWMMRDLLAGMGEEPAWSYEKMYKQARKSLMHLHMAAQRERRSFAVVIDEIDHISRKGRLLESLRDLSDDLELPFILVGMGRVRHNLTRFPQVASRVSQSVVFTPISLEEAITLTETSHTIKVATELIAFLHTAARGHLREIREALKAIERFALRNQCTQIGIRDMVGETLFLCRRTGKPVKVIPR